MEKNLPEEIKQCYMEQYVSSIESYSSRYNTKAGISYAPITLIGKPTRYPDYGDFPDTYILRSYGKWYQNSASYQKEYMPQESDPIESEDFIIVRFDQAVIPSKVLIYETCNPGAVVRIWAADCYGQWVLLWKGPPQICAKRARIFSPPLKKMLRTTFRLRIEFNQSLLDYHTALDAIILAGYKGIAYLFLNAFFSEDDQKQKQIEDKTDSDSSKQFSSLPVEVVTHIFGFLDIKSLCACAQVNTTFLAITKDPLLYKNISFKRYWHCLIRKTLTSFIPKCTHLVKLDLSWCGYNGRIRKSEFVNFLEECGKSLTHLSLSHCFFVQKAAFTAISKCTELIELRLQGNSFMHFETVSDLSMLTNLQTLDIYGSNILDVGLVPILINNNNLRHLIIDLCEHLNGLDAIMETLSIHNKKLETLSMWKCMSLSQEGVKFISRLPELRELDMGWVLFYHDPGNSLDYLAQGCPHLTRLVLSCWRSLIGDIHLYQIIRYCKKLRQLDLVGIRSISPDICEHILRELPNLELLDIHFCTGILEKHVEKWTAEYPHVIINNAVMY